MIELLLDTCVCEVLVGRSAESDQKGSLRALWGGKTL